MESPSFVEDVASGKFSSMKEVQAQFDELWKMANGYNDNQNYTHLRYQNYIQPVLTELSKRNVQRLISSKDVLINAIDSYDNVDDNLN